VRTLFRWHGVYVPVRLDLRLVLHAMDIANKTVEIGKWGVYSLVPPGFVGKDIFDRMTAAEMEELFDMMGM
jgi:hypothetical protein